MPAPRLPWVKLWIESLEHEKVAMLSDAEYRTWTACLLRGSQQPIKWRFGSKPHAARVTGRPLKHITALIARGLLDERADGVWVHDAAHWQDRHPSDYTRANAQVTVGEGSAERPSIKEGTPRKSSTKTPRTLRERSANAPGSLPLDREGERESSAPDGAGAAVAAPTARRERETSPVTPAVRAANTVLRKTCDPTEREAVNAGVPDEPPALRKWEAVLKEYHLRYPGNKAVVTALDWFAHGIPPRKSEEIREQQKSRGQGTSAAFADEAAAVQRRMAAQHVGAA